MVLYDKLMHFFGAIMIDNQTINRLSDKINDLLPEGLQQAKSDFDSRLKSLLQQQLSNYQMVSREEFDIQARVLQRTREKLETIEKRLKELEQTLDWNRAPVITGSEAEITLKKLLWRSQTKQHP